MKEKFYYMTREYGNFSASKDSDKLFISTREFKNEDLPESKKEAMVYLDGRSSWYSELLSKNAIPVNYHFLVLLLVKAVTEEQEILIYDDDEVSSCEEGLEMEAEIYRQLGLPTDEL